MDAHAFEFYKKYRTMSTNVDTNARSHNLISRASECNGVVVASGVTSSDGYALIT